MALQMQKDLYGCGQQHWSSSSQVLRARIKYKDVPIIKLFDQQFGNAQERRRPGVETELCVLGMEPMSAIATTSAEIGGNIFKKRPTGSHLPVCCFC